MLSALRHAWALFLGIAILMLAHGLQGTLLGLRANLEGFADVTTGIVMSGYYLGLLVGSLRVPVLVARVGHVRVFAALLSLGSTAILFQAVFVEPVAWFLMRFLTGYCFAGAFIVAESWLNGSASNDKRGLILSLYMVVQLGSMAGGQFLLNLADPRGFDLFILVSVLISVAAVPMLLTAVAAPTVTSSRAISLRTLYRLSPLGVVGLIGTGVGTSGLFSLAPVYANQEGLSVAALSTFMAAMTLGGVAFQLPIGRLSDRLDRRKVIAAVTILTALALLPPALLPQIPNLMLYPGFFLVGGLCLPVYALCVAHTNDFLNSEQMVGASSALVLAFGIGAAAGPTLTALSMQVLGTLGFPVFIALTHLLIGLFAIWRMTRRAPVPMTDRGAYISLPTPTPVVIPMAQEKAVARSPTPSGPAAPALADAG